MFPEQADCTLVRFKVFRKRAIVNTNLIHDDIGPLCPARLIPAQLARFFWPRRLADRLRVFVWYPADEAVNTGESAHELIRNHSRDMSKTIIEKAGGWNRKDILEVLRYRDLFYFLVWRDIKVLYAQTIMGFSWAILQPLIQVVLFTIIFGKVANIPTDGIPYFLFSTVAVIPWTYMSSAMSQSSMSLVSGQGMLGKVYFPRIIYPLTSILSKLMDFFISLLIVIAVLVYYKVTPTLNLIYLPLFFLFMIIVPLGVGLWLSSLAIRFRDVKFAMQFFIRMLMYSAPVIYAASSIPEEYKFLYSLNPLVSVIEGFRVCLLGGILDWGFILPGMVTALIILVTGALYFKHTEHIFADVI